MSEATPETSPETTPETEDVLPTTTSQRTYLSDDGHGPLPETATDRGPVTTYADHVPKDAPVVLSTKVVAAPSADTPPTPTPGVETA